MSYKSQYTHSIILGVDVQIETVETAVNDYVLTP